MMSAAPRPVHPIHPGSQTCDRCGPSVTAAYRVRRRGDLFLCGHCTNSLWLDLFAAGWSIWRAQGPTLVYREVSGACLPQSRLDFRTRELDAELPA
jgi:ribosomal protein S27AE